MKWLSNEEAQLQASGSRGSGQGPWELCKIGMYHDTWLRYASSEELSQLAYADTQAEKASKLIA